MSEPVTALRHALNVVGDWTAGSLTVLTVAKLLPAVAALFSVLWYAIGIYEKITGKRFSQSALARTLRLGSDL